MFLEESGDPWDRTGKQVGAGLKTLKWHRSKKLVTDTHTASSLSVLVNSSSKSCNESTRCTLEVACSPEEKEWLPDLVLRSIPPSLKDFNYLLARLHNLTATRLYITRISQLVMTRLLVEKVSSDQ